MSKSSEGKEYAHDKGEKDYSKSGGQASSPITEIFHPTYNKLLVRHNGKGHAAFATWPLLMPATTYSPTHFRVQYNRPCGA